MPSEPMKWAELRNTVLALKVAASAGDVVYFGLHRLLAELDAVAPAMEEQERIVEAVLAWGRILNTSEPDDSLFVPQKMAMVKVRDLAQKLAAERAKGATDGPR
jgi:hypothetical protein